VGFLGAGLIANYHARSLRASGEDVSWAAVYDPDGARADQFAQAWGTSAASSEEEAVDRSDAVYVCTWTSEHPRLVGLAASAGKAVFCEKPLATDVAGARGMAAAVARAGVVNQVGLVLRASPALRALAQRVADPAVGRVMAVVFRDDQYIPVQGMYGSTWRGEVDKAGAGTLLEHSIHDVDVLRWLCGPIVSVSAVSHSFHGIVGIEDAVVATLEFEGGAAASLTSVWHDVLSRPSLRRIEVLCERAWFALESDWAGPLRVSTSEGESVVGEFPEAVNPDGAFVRAVREGGPAFPDFAVAVRAHEVVDALYRSAAGEGTRQTLPRIDEGCQAPSAAS
jgi:predicted dehydrogenase